jgi:hypothetical protein
MITPRMSLGSLWHQLEDLVSEAADSLINPKLRKDIRRMLESGRLRGLPQKPSSTAFPWEVPSTFTGRRSGKAAGYRLIWRTRHGAASGVWDPRTLGPRRTRWSPTVPG